MAVSIGCHSGRVRTCVLGSGAASPSCHWYSLCTHTGTGRHWQCQWQWRSLGNTCAGSTVYRRATLVHARFIGMRLPLALGRQKLKTGGDALYSGAAGMPVGGRAQYPDVGIIQVELPKENFNFKLNLKRGGPPGPAPNY